MSSFVFTTEVSSDHFQFHRVASEGCCWLLLAIVCVCGQTATAVDKIYHTDFLGSTIDRSNTDGTNVEPIVASGTNALIHIDADSSGGKIYWSEFMTGVRRSDLDGSNEELIVPLSGSDSPFGVAVDVSAGKVYWTSPGVNKIQKANLDGTTVEDVVTTAGEPIAIAIDPGGSKLYWSEDNDELTVDSFIRRSDLNGANVQDVRNLGQQALANGISLDLTNQMLYWSENTNDAGTMWRSALDGSGPSSIIPSLLEETGEVEVDAAGGKLYWTIPDQAMIQRSNLDGTMIEDIFTGTVGNDIPWGLAIASIGGGLGCDFNSSTTCNLTDLNLMYARGNLGSGVAVGGGDAMDLNSDLSLNGDDITEWLSQSATANSFLTPYLRGDTDLDRDVDITDFNVLAVNFGDTVPKPNFEDGNFNGDPTIDITDFNFVAANFGDAGNGGSQLNAVPEPSALFLGFGLGLAVLIGIRYRR